MRTLDHSPADVIRYLLIQKGWAVAPGSTPWPVYASAEPFSPDNLLAIYDTTGADHGRVMQGELQGLFGFMIRIRAVDHPTGWSKADGLRNLLAESVYEFVVAINSARYLVHAISKIKEVNALGKDTDSKRSLFTINAVASIRQQ